MTTAEKTLRDVREALVREHLDSENRQDFDTTLAGFEHPRYELMAGGEVFDGAKEVAEYYRRSRTAFPDQRNELVSIRHADDAVIVEFDLFGTHLGELFGLPPTGRTFSCRMVAMFLFEDERMVCERVYYNAGTITTQLGLFGVPRDA